MRTPPVASLLDLTGTTALVTGAGSGIGTGIAARLAEAGARVAVHFHTSRAGADAVVATITQAGGQARAFGADLTRPDEVEGLVSAVTGTLGAVDILVNNAGTYPLGTIIDVDFAEWQAVVSANLSTVHLVTQATARALREAGRPGAIVNIASIEASNVAPAHSHYIAAKAGVVMYTRSAARELGPLGIRVNAVSPGLIGRPGLAEAWPQGVQAYTAATPLGRLGEFEDVADACLFLASPAARWITGVELIVDGGVLTNRAY
ncbi:short-chain dehydrogenase [Luteitalea sp. TBR-22]|uniref:SDR family NAD(P)-dependent oxidoreductase n=1 Tax=Luteitalea sp. TBR-22 TaxID=2802971 RepID=UPI001AF51624|nr:SDR family NAD(P)-dependent oxidoreductase [Luteitalea sp. TBR-22]BCS31191.1 short-chain dehydrogenase [Luteitalea sp. TBR-22]